MKQLSIVNRFHHFILFITLIALSGCQFSCKPIKDTDRLKHNWLSLVQPEMLWNYHAVASKKEKPDSSWHDPRFQDDSWRRGPGPLGFGDKDDKTVVKPCRALYLRINFQIADLDAIRDLLLFADYDDAFIAFLNGQEIARCNSWDIGKFQDWNAKLPGIREARIYQGGKPEQFLIPSWQWRDKLQEGENLLAIQINNDSSKSKDLTAWFALYASTKQVKTSEPLPDWFQAPVELEASDLPLLRINTDQKHIPDDPKIDASLIIELPTGTEKSKEDSSSISIKIEQRGSSSRTRFPKKSYGFTTYDGNGKKLDQSLLGMPSDNDWILYGPYSDKTMMRNALVFHLARQMGHYAPRTAFCELLINEQYEGVYLLMEKIKSSGGRLNLEKLESDDLSGDALTGAYLLKIDKRTGNKTKYWHSKYRAPADSSKKIRFQIHRPKKQKLAEEQFQYIRNYMDQFEDALMSDFFGDQDKGYAKYIDVRSFIDFFLLNELSYNLDGYRVSTFLYKDRDSKGGKLHMGPLWDFNLAFGNGYNCEKENEGYLLMNFNRLCEDKAYHVPFWWERLLEDAAYKQALIERWKQLRSNLLSEANLMNWIDQRCKLLDNAQERNFKRWPTMGVKVWPNLYKAKDFEDEVDFMKGWLKRRLLFLDKTFEEWSVQLEHEQ